MCIFALRCLLYIFIVSFYLVFRDVRSPWNNKHRGSVFLDTVKRRGIEMKPKYSLWTRRMYGSQQGRGIGRGRRETGAARIEARPGWAQRQDGGDYVCVVGLMGRRWQVWRWPW